MILSEELAWRGFVNQTTLSDITELNQRKFKLYFGVDPSSDSMTVGNLASAMMVRCFMKHGHEVTLLVGGATGMIGDPSGKDEERSLLTPEQVANNRESIAAQYRIIFKSEKFRLVDNYDWFKDLNYLDFLREIGKHFSMTPLLQRDYIATRLGEGGSGISYAEFSYTLIQGYDYYHLNQKYDIDLQVCGSDQWGNSISGVELIRRKTGREAHIYSAPLVINRSTGKKFGKTEDGAVWLDPDKTSVYKFYQFWLNVDDDSASEYLKVFTELDKAQISEVMKQFEADRAGRLAQKTLAYEVTKIVHGQQAADSVVKATAVLFGEKQIDELNAAELKILREELSSTKAAEDVAQTMVNAELAGSKSEALRLIDSGAVSLNGQKIDSKDAELSPGVNLLKKGKNSFAIVDN